jgi:hypothetical protein
MPKYRVIPDLLQKINKKEECFLSEHEESELRLSHGIYAFLNLDIIPTDTRLLKGNKGMAFFKIWKLRKKRKIIYSFGLQKNTKF